MSAGSEQRDVRKLDFMLEMNGQKMRFEMIDADVGDARRLEHGERRRRPQVDQPVDLLQDPYPYFAKKRRESGVFKGSVMDWSKTPESMMPEHLYAAVSFDAVNRVFRDGKVFNSHIYDSTIGLFIGPSILAMEGKKHWEHRNLVSAAFKSKSLLRWEPEIVRPVVNGLIDEFRLWVFPVIAGSGKRPCPAGCVPRSPRSGSGSVRRDR